MMAARNIAKRLVQGDIYQGLFIFNQLAIKAHFVGIRIDSGAQFNNNAIIYRNPPGLNENLTLSARTNTGSGKEFL
jgi:hypothetical protein